jgi:DNA polymerase-4
MERIIVHSDLNAFYASVEGLRNPRLRDIPMAVCGSTEDRHGIVLAGNYPAKRLGVKTAMPIWEAKRHCPELITVRPRMTDYIQFSGFVREIYSEYSDRVESFGLDEAWLDLTGCVDNYKQGELAIEEIRKRIYKELGLTVSVGLSFTKTFAKLGSDIKKPDACTSIPKEGFKQIVWPLPLRDLLYVGPATEKKFHNRAIYTIGDLANTDTKILKSMLGKVGLVLHAFANGEDKSPVNNIEYNHPIKSIGNSTTCPRDLETDQDVMILLYALSESVGARLMENGFYATTVELSFVGTNLSFHFTRQAKLDKPTNISGELAKTAFELFKKHYSHWPSPLRKIGVRSSNLVTTSTSRQLDIFGDEEHRADMEQLEATINRLRARFGNKIIQRGIMHLDPTLSKVDAKKDHLTYPEGVFKEGMGVALNGRNIFGARR